MLPCVLRTLTVPFFLFILCLQATGPVIPPASAPPIAADSASAIPPAQLADQDDAFPPDIRAIKERGVLRVGMFYQDRIPFFMHDSAGNLVGLDPDIARGVAEKLGVGIEFIRTQTYGDAVNCVIEKKCDMAISKLSLTMARAQKVLYTDKYVNAFKVLLVNRVELQKLNRSGTESLESAMAGGKFVLAVPSGSSYEEFAHALFPKANLVFYDSRAEEGIPNLLRGKYTAIFTDELEAYDILHALPGASFQLMVIKLTGAYDPLYMAVHPESTHLWQFLQRYIESEGLLMTAQELLENIKYAPFVQKHLETEQENWKTMLTKRKTQLVP